MTIDIHVTDRKITIGDVDINLPPSTTKVSVNPIVSDSVDDVVSLKTSYIAYCRGPIFYSYELHDNSQGTLLIYDKPERDGRRVIERINLDDIPLPKYSIDVALEQAKGSQPLRRAFDIRDFVRTAKLKLESGAQYTGLQTVVQQPQSFPSREIEPTGPNGRPLVYVVVYVPDNYNVTKH